MSSYSAHRYAAWTVWMRAVLRAMNSSRSAITYGRWLPAQACTSSLWKSNSFLYLGFAATLARRTVQKAPTSTQRSTAWLMSCVGLTVNSFITSLRSSQVSSKSSIFFDFQRFVYFSKNCFSFRLAYSYMYFMYASDLVLYSAFSSFEKSSLQI